MPHLARRATLARLAALALPGPWPLAGLADERTRPQPLAFPQDFGAHPERRIEWWYLTGWLADPAAPEQPLLGLQITFFRSRTDVRADHPSAFAARQLLMAHAALGDVRDGRLLHDQRIARAGFGIAVATVGDSDARLRDWRLWREPVAGQPAAQASVYRVSLGRSALADRLDLSARSTGPVLLQGRQGWSRKGPGPAQFSHYYSQPQLEVQASLTRDGRTRGLVGRAWLDHEWSDSLLDPEAIGWDWIGFNLFDGRALTAFRLRRHNRQAASGDDDGATLWTGGSSREPDGRSRSFEHAGGEALRWTPLRHWTSPATKARYPVEWQLDSPAGRYRVRALFDAQELDSRASTGTVYWEGLSELLDADGRQRLGLGYLEMTGYAERLQLR
ncbi:lipocalin-like domain-containing protein [Leptothrix discophora]|uniref:Carotenoid 1,2-hydratase n=1 Tax=Leptothrix discophora TaxID=89 RepID=A0ABT9G390_LEPDI|nr:carotenoid 1,2-hydratase [Leptothrix discophora]MDP4300648.1 carotenoid 1,2-hydratase [Leptothrix discophora]